MKPKILIIYLIIFVLFGCNSSVSNVKEIDRENNEKGFIPNSVYVFKEELPLDFAHLGLNKVNERITLSDGKEALIIEAIDEYVASLGVLPNMDYQPYVGTVWIKESNHDIYFVIFKHITGVLNTKVIIWNSYSNPPVFFDYNIHAMYSLNNKRIVKTDLKELLFEDIPLVKITDSLNATLLELNRLYHNGTANLLENTVLRIDKLNQLDTINHSLKIIEKVNDDICEVDNIDFLNNLDESIRVIPLNKECFNEVNFDDDPYLEKLVFFELKDNRRGIMIFQENGDYNIFGINQEDIGGHGIVNDLSWIETIQILPRGEKIYKTIVDSESGDILGVDSTSYHKLMYESVQFGVEESGGGAVLYWENDRFDWIEIE
jgi:hypothetical protein